MRLGALVRYVPVTIVIGFTNGIAVLIALSQLRGAFGLRIEGKLPADFLPRSRPCGGTHRAGTLGAAAHRAVLCRPVALAAPVEQTPAAAG